MIINFKETDANMISDTLNSKRGVDIVSTDRTPELIQRNFRKVPIYSLTNVEIEQMNNLIYKDDQNP